MTYKLVSEIGPINGIFDSPDCIYDIRIIINFNNTSFLFPSNCVLRFSGGKLLNATTLIGQSTQIEAPAYQIFDNITFLEGTWDVAFGYAEWFGATGSSVSAYVDDYQGLQKAFDSPFDIKLLDKTYCTSNGLSINRCKSICGIGNVRSKIWAMSSASITNLVSINADSVELGHLELYGRPSNSSNAYTRSTSSRVTNIIANNQCTSKLHLFDIVASCCVDTAIKLTTFMSTFERVVASYCKVGFHINGAETASGTTTRITSCFAMYAWHLGYNIEYLNYSSLECCAADFCGYNFSNKNVELNNSYPYMFFGCDGISIISCGCEQCYNTMYMNCCRSFNICSFMDWNNNQVADRSLDINNRHHSKQFYIRNSRGILFDRCSITFPNIQEPSSKQCMSFESSMNIGFNYCYIRNPSLTDNVINISYCILTNSNITFNEGNT